MRFRAYGLMLPFGFVGEPAPPKANCTLRYIWIVAVVLCDSSSDPKGAVGLFERTRHMQSTQLFEQLRASARKLHREAQVSDASALRCVKKHSELRSLPREAIPAAVQRKHCLGVLAAKCGFSGWSHLTHVVSGATCGDFGTLLHSKACFAHTNVWCASYAEAVSVRAEHGGTLLPYKLQFLIVDEHYLCTLGVGRERSEWQALGNDWVSPKSHVARQALYAVLIRGRLAMSEELDLCS